jgi:hypothetical protein
MTSNRFAHEALRAGYDLAKIMLIGAVLPIVAVSLLSFAG